MKDSGAGTGKVIKTKIPEPILVSMKRISPSAYIVVDIRRQNFALAKDAINSVQVVGDALVFKGGRIIRLTIERELRSNADVRALSSAINSWADKVRRRS